MDETSKAGESASGKAKSTAACKHREPISRRMTKEEIEVYERMVAGAKQVELEFKKL